MAFGFLVRSVGAIFLLGSLGQDMTSTAARAEERRCRKKFFNASVEKSKGTYGDGRASM